MLHRPPANNLVGDTAHGDFSGDERKNIKSGAKRSPGHYMFSKSGLLKTIFHYK